MLIERVDDPELIARMGQSASFGTRSTDTLHLSDIYKSLMTRLQPKRFGKPIDGDALRRMEVGIAFENVLEQGLAEKFATTRTGEIVSDEGIHMSPDGVNPVLDCGEEYKATWMSARPLNFGKSNQGTSPYTDEYGMPTDKYLHWFIQMKGYAKWLGTRKFQLRALHVNGDYQKHGDSPFPYNPQFLTHQIEFTPHEIDENWTMLTNYARIEKMLR